MSTVKFIYNPKAGEKRPFYLRKEPEWLLQTIHHLFRKYEIEVDETPTQSPHDARRLAMEAANEGYETVIVAGGDGTVGEAANGLVGTQTALGILPMGTFMNVARMLSIPFDLELAMMMIKMRNIRTIDAGEILSLEGEHPRDPVYFLESVGIGIEAEFQNEFRAWEQGDLSALGRFLKLRNRTNLESVTIELDGGRLINAAADAVMISNGPYAGAAIPVAPNAKLNDHHFTVRVYYKSKLKLIQHFLRLKLLGKYKDPEIETYTAKTVRITSTIPVSLHADARVFGTTPISISLRPSALRVIAGYPDSPEESGMIAKKTYLSP